MICYVLAMGQQHLGPHVVVGYGIKVFWPGLFITSPDHLAIACYTSVFVVRAKMTQVTSRSNKNHFST